MKGIVLAGGSGTRLRPMTEAISKQLLPVYDKPMIYYPLSILMLAGIQDILIISTSHDLNNFRRLLGDGSKFGLNLSYEEQPKPNGLAEALIIGEEFINGGPCALILGDNVFYGGGLTRRLKKAFSRDRGATVFGYYVPDPARFGVVELNALGRPISLEEKPKVPKSNYAITGLYFYDHRAVEWAKSLKPSKRGELEITDLNRMYLEDGSLDVELLHRGSAWFDTGTVESLAAASGYIRALEVNQGIQIASLEEIAFNNGWITREHLIERANYYKGTAYGQHLLNVADRKIVNSYLTVMA